MKELEFENIFVAYIKSKIANDELTKMRISSVAFPDKKKPVRTLQKMTTDNLEKRQRMTLEDAHRICSAMGITLSYVCSMIEKGDAQRIIAATPLPEPKPGRKKKQAAIPAMEQLALPDNAETVREDGKND